MFKASFRLLQHTPLIHFQHDQIGATLRATEIKPKLDKYLIKYAFENDSSKYGSLKIGGKKGEHPALDYKLFVRSSGPFIRNDKIPKNDRNVPMFFGNMGNEYLQNPKGLKQYRGASIAFSSFHTIIVDKIKEHIAAFFAQTNFGMRQSKGYGSFTIKEDYEFPSDFYRFTLKEEDVLVVMKTIDLFYKSLRGGINGAIPPKRDKGFAKSFYMKPMLFLYAKKDKVQWEKKTIKEDFFNRDLIDQQQDRKNNINIKREDQQEWPLWYIHEKKKIVRDVLGLSTQQSWRGYGRGNGASITKEHVDEKGVPIGKKDAITRFKSPLFFKPVFNKKEKMFTIYFRPEPIPPEEMKKYLGSHFLISNDGTPMKNALPMWDNFDLSAFLEFAFKPGKLKEAIQFDSKDGYAKEIADTLTHIYQDILKNQ